MRIFLISMIVLLMPGCMWVESMTKAATDAALEAVSAKIPVISEDLKAVAKKYKDEAIEAATDKAAKAAVKYGRAGMLHVIRQAKLDPMEFDIDGDGVLSDSELNDECEQQGIPVEYRGISSS